MHGMMGVNGKKTINCHPDEDMDAGMDADTDTDLNHDHDQDLDVDVMITVGAPGVPVTPSKKEAA